MPGPGAYQERSYLKEGPQYSIYTRRDEKIEQTPGPGDYDEIKKQGKGVTIGVKFKEREQEELPGPGHYEEKSRIVEGPQFSIFSRHESKIEQTPGPGDYNEPEKEMKGVTIGERYKQREVEDSEIEPGPGHYRYFNPQLEGKGVSFTKERRDKNKDAMVPGPGNYGRLDDWAPGYGYEMSISSKAFDKSQAYEMSRRQYMEEYEDYEYRRQLMEAEAQEQVEYELRRKYVPGVVQEEQEYQVESQLMAVDEGQEQQEYAMQSQMMAVEGQEQQEYAMQSQMMAAEGQEQQEYTIQRRQDMTAESQEQQEYEVNRQLMASEIQESQEYQMSRQKTFTQGRDKQKFQTQTHKEVIETEDPRYKGYIIRREYVTTTDIPVGTHEYEVVRKYKTSKKPEEIQEEQKVETITTEGRAHQTPEGYELVKVVTSTEDVPESEGYKLLGELRSSQARSSIIRSSQAQSAQIKSSKTMTSKMAESRLVKSGGYEVIEEVSELKPSKTIKYSREVTTTKTPQYKSYVKTRTISSGGTQVQRSSEKMGIKSQRIITETEPHTVSSVKQESRTIKKEGTVGLQKGSTIKEESQSMTKQGATSYTYKTITHTESPSYKIYKQSRTIEPNEELKEGSSTIVRTTTEAPMLEASEEVKTTKYTAKYSKEGDSKVTKSPGAQITKTYTTSFKSSGPVSSEVKNISQRYKAIKSSQKESSSSTITKKYSTTSKTTKQVTKSSTIKKTTK